VGCYSGEVQHWWGDKECQQVKGSQAPPQQKEKAPGDGLDSDHKDPYTLSLDDWES
jgi:hypothetical protein